MNEGLKKKLAVIRGNGTRNCPFGLKIIDACKDAGNAVYNMMPLSEKNTEEQNENSKTANNLIYTYQKENKKCAFADEILEQQNKVDCDFGDNGQGFHSVDFRGSPLYPSTFHGFQFDGLYNGGLGLYNEPMRNLPYGMWSFNNEMVEEDTVIKISNRTMKISKRARKIK